MARAAVALLALGLAMVGTVGCGEEEGVAEGAAVTVYVEKPLCLDGGEVGLVNDGEPNGFEARFVCLPGARRAGLSLGVGGGRQVDLAIAGANARRASEDSTAVAYLQPNDPAVRRFTQPILEAAGIGWIADDSRAATRIRVMELLAEADPSSVRADVREALGQ